MTDYGLAGKSAAKKKEKEEAAQQEVVVGDSSSMESILRSLGLEKEAICCWIMAILTLSDERLHPMLDQSQETLDWIDCLGFH